MIWEQLCKDFEFIVAWDTEFKGDIKDAGELMIQYAVSLKN